MVILIYARFSLGLNPIFRVEKDGFGVERENLTFRFVIRHIWMEVHTLYLLSVHLAQQNDFFFQRIFAKIFQKKQIFNRKKKIFSFHSALLFLKRWLFVTRHCCFISCVDQTKRRRTLPEKANYQLILILVCHWIFFSRISKPSKFIFTHRT